MSYAIIRTGGKQFRVEPGKTLRIPTLVGDAGASSRVQRRPPRLRRRQTCTLACRRSRARKVTGEIVKHGRGDKIVVFKYQAPEELREKAGASAGLHRSPHQGHHARLERGDSMAHKKGVGSSRNGRDSNPQYRGVKKFGGEQVIAGNIIVRQCGTKWHPGRNVGLGTDYTIYSLIDGVVKFEHKSKTRYKVSVYPAQATKRPLPDAAFKARKAPRLAGPFFFSRLAHLAGHRACNIVSGSVVVRRDPFTGRSPWQSGTSSKPSSIAPAKRRRTLSMKARFDSRRSELASSPTRRRKHWATPYIARSSRAAELDAETYARLSGTLATHETEADAARAAASRLGATTKARVGGGGAAPAVVGPGVAAATRRYCAAGRISPSI